MTVHAAAGPIPDHYFLDARIFTDPQIFAEELDKLFGHAWVFLGHKCEAKAPNSFFCFEIGGTPVVVCRDASSRLHGFIDACRECDGTVVTGRWGKGPLLRCAAGHAAYDLDGQAVEGVRKEGLEPIAIELLHGLVYGSLAPLESLRAFLGEALLSWWEPIFRPDVEWELVHVFSFPTAVNWKAFMQPGDGYHVQGLHRIFAKHALAEFNTNNGRELTFQPELVQQLQEHRGDIAAVANALGVHRTTVTRKLRKYGIAYQRRHTQPAPGVPAQLPVVETEARP